MEFYTGCIAVAVALQGMVNFRVNRALDSQRSRVIAGALKAAPCYFKSALIPAEASTCMAVCFAFARSGEISCACVSASSAST
jgi:hypothetical protein